jgi:hypothetical protein
MTGTLSGDAGNADRSGACNDADFQRADALAVAGSGRVSPHHRQGAAWAASPSGTGYSVPHALQRRVVAPIGKPPLFARDRPYAPQASPIIRPPAGLIKDMRGHGQLGVLASPPQRPIIRRFP